MNTNVVIVGAGNAGHELAARLRSRHPVILVDIDASHLTPYGPPVVIEQGTAISPRLGTIIPVAADASSRLVQRALLSVEASSTLIAATGNDEVNIEVGKVAKELGFDPVIAVQHSDHNETNFRREGIISFNRSKIVAEYIEQTIQYKGAVAPLCIGLGKGELLELCISEMSPILGQPLRQLSLHQFRIAAIFRGNELIVPMGDTVLMPKDRVLFVGDPAVLASITEYLRIGTPRFPMPYGPTLVTLEWEGPDEGLLAEASHFSAACDAAPVCRGLPSDQSASKDPEKQARSFALLPIGHSGFQERVKSERPGLVLTKASMKSVLERVLGLRGPDARLCDTLDVPILISRGSIPYNRIIFPISADEDSPGLGLAIDLARRFSLPIIAVHVDLPQFITGEHDDALHEDVVHVKRMCDLFHVPMEHVHLEGNPIERLADLTGPQDLLVVTRRRKRSDSFLHPDVALRTALSARCSVLVLSPEHED
ncbi:MAG: TrkA C-terminal domain-containing protein [Myxococcota bacterium]|jgi:Trk K+ transport system NAD-binding subunit/nucleotide-binding universal stress UspA family protein|nr:TrkA C-terminal domain-containing protein [Myxococcota bacterium]